MQSKSNNSPLLKPPSQLWEQLDHQIRLLQVLVPVDYRQSEEGSQLSVADSHLSVVVDRALQVLEVYMVALAPSMWTRTLLHKPMLNLLS